MTYRTIVFAYDGSAEGQAALAEGIELASLVGARCHLLAVMSVPPEAKYAQVVVPEDCIDEDCARTRRILQEGVERFREAGLEVDGVIRVGEAAPVIGSDRVVFRSTASGAEYGHVASVPLTDPSGPRAISDEARAVLESHRVDPTPTRRTS